MRRNDKQHGDKRSERQKAVESLQLALDLVEEGADPDWKVAALAAVEKTCKELREFISDDIWRTGGLDLTRENRALGPVILTARKLGWCDKTGRFLSSTRSHLRPMPVWRSHLYGHPDGAGLVDRATGNGSGGSAVHGGERGSEEEISGRR